MGAGGKAGFFVDEWVADKANFQSFAKFFLQLGNERGRRLIAGRAEKIFKESEKHTL